MLWWELNQGRGWCWGFNRDFASGWSGGLGWSGGVDLGTELLGWG